MFKMFNKFICSIFIVLVMALSMPVQSQNFTERNPIHVCNRVAETVTPLLYQNVVQGYSEENALRVIKTYNGFARNNPDFAKDIVEVAYSDLQYRNSYQLQMIVRNYCLPYAQ